MTSSLMESQVKEFNLRVKGSEKFWHVEHAEAMLQSIAETLREDGPTLSDRILPPRVTVPTDHPRPRRQ